MLEVEVKVRANIEEMENKLSLLGFKKGTIVYEKDTYYNGRLYDLKEADKALRIRVHKDLGSGKIRYVLNFKGPKLDAVTMTRDETQFEVPSLEAGEKVINGLGYFAAGGVEKTRIHYKKDHITCCLDEVTGLGSFLEIEIMALDQAAYDDAIKTIHSVLDSLGLSMDDTVNHSYLSMLEERP